jgi:hypothetical protein
MASIFMPKDTYISDVQMAAVKVFWIRLKESFDAVKQPLLIFQAGHVENALNEIVAELIDGFVKGCLDIIKMLECFMPRNSAYDATHTRSMDGMRYGLCTARHIPNRAPIPSGC